MRRLLTSQELELTESALRWGEQKGRWRRADRGVWAEGPEDVGELDRARAAVVATGGVASHHLAGVLHGLDAVTHAGPWVTLPRKANGRRPNVSRRALPAERIVTVAGLPCTDGWQTMVDLATSLDDAVWEQALESALRKRLTSVDALRGHGNRRVLVRRGDVPATESLLETLMVQLARTVPGLPDPVRQYWVEEARGPARPGLAGAGAVRGARRPAPQGAAGLRRPAGDGGGGRDRLAVRAVHVVRGGAPPHDDRRRLGALSRAAVRPPGRPGRETGDRSAAGRRR